jgi:TatD DNase family protein
MLIDAHAHLDHYQQLMETALQEIRQYRILTVSNSMDLPSYQRNMEIAGLCEWVVPALGIHPWRAPKYAGRLDELSDWIEQSPMLGEIGLDFHWVEDPACYPAQRQVFEFFLAAAREQDKLVNLHTKGAEAEVLECLERHHIQRAIVHWYSGPLDVFREMLGWGFMFTVGVEVSTSRHIQALAQELPLSHLLTETDNPGGLEWLTGQAGMPHHLLEVVQAVAELKHTTPEAIQQAVQRNWERLVQGDPRLAGRWVGLTRIVPELAREIERARLEAGLSIEELLDTLREQRERYDREIYAGDRPE